MQGLPHHEHSVAHLGDAGSVAATGGEGLTREVTITRPPGSERTSARPRGVSRTQVEPAYLRFRERPPDQIVILDVGHAYATIIHDAGAVTVIEAGHPRPLLRYLEGEGVSRIDRLVITQGSTDEIAGVTTLLGDSRRPIGEVYVNPDPTNTSMVSGDVSSPSPGTPTLGSSHRSRRQVRFRGQPLQSMSSLPRQWICLDARRQRAQLGQALPCSALPVVGEGKFFWQRI